MARPLQRSGRRRQPTRRAGDGGVVGQPDLPPDMTEDVWRQTQRGRKYQVIINFNNSEYCGTEAARPRDLVIHSLAPNRDTAFPGK